MLTSTTAIWIVITANLGMAVGHLWMARLYRRKLKAQIVTDTAICDQYEQASAQFRRATEQYEHAKRTKEMVEAAARDFTMRVMAGDVRVTTDDGAVGVLVVTPEGEQALRLRVDPMPPQPRRVQ
jgi:hypothetical protein